VKQRVATTHRARRRDAAQGGSTADQVWYNDAWELRRLLAQNLSAGQRRHGDSLALWSAGCSTGRSILRQRRCVSRDAWRAHCETSSAFAGPVLDGVHIFLALRAAFRTPRICACWETRGDGQGKGRSSASGNEGGGRGGDQEHEQRGPILSYRPLIAKRHSRALLPPARVPHAVCAPHAAGQVCGAGSLAV
jgi:hypothetical protein